MPKSALLLTLSIVLLLGCEQLTAIQPSGQPTPSSGGATAATLNTPPSTSAISRVTATLTIQPGATRSATTPLPSVQRTSAPPLPALTLRITSPQDEAIVSTASITVIGQTIAGAVVSVNGNLADVDASGNFRYSLTLDEGPNIIEVVASDQNGNELGMVLSVIYEP